MHIEQVGMERTICFLNKCEEMSGMIFVPRNNVNISMRTIMRGLFDSRLKKDAPNNYVQEFQRRFAEYIGVNCALGVSSARTGLYMVLKTLRMNAEDEVILSAYNFEPIPILVKSLGYKPVFIDITENTPNIDVEKIEGAISSSTRCILVSHMCGYPVNMDKIMEIAKRNKLYVIEDCAHALGATYKGKMVGSFGDAGIFSFGYGKMMPCFGGGIITCNNKNLYLKLANLIQGKNRFSIEKFLVTLFFYIFTHKNIFPWTVYPFIRLTPSLGDKAIREKKSCGLTPYERMRHGLSSFQAKTGIFQLDNMALFLKTVTENSKVMDNFLKGNKKIRLMEVGSEDKPAYLYYRIMVEDRELYRRLLLHQGIDTKAESMCTPDDLRPFINVHQRFKNAEYFKANNIEIPNGPNLSLKDIEYIADKINKI